MPSSQSDYILRLIEQLAGALRRMRERLADGSPADADILRESEQHQAELFGPLWPMLRSVDAETAVSLVADRRRVELWIEFIRFEAEVAESLGDEPRATTARERAARLEQQLEARYPER